MATLRIQVQGRTYDAPLPDRRIAIGTGDACDLRLTSPGVATVHCYVEPLGDGRYVVRDAKSGSETRVNGARVEQLALDHGATIQLGNVAIEFREGPAPVAAPAAVASPPQQPRTPSQPKSPSQAKPRPKPKPRPESEYVPLPPKKKGVPLWAIAAGLAVVGLGVGLALSGGKTEDNSTEVARRTSDAQQHAAEGRIDDALTAIDGLEGGDTEELRRQWRLTKRLVEKASDAIWSSRFDLDAAMRESQMQDVIEKHGAAGAAAIADLRKRITASHNEWIAQRKAEFDEASKHDRIANRFAQMRSRWDQVASRVPPGIDAQRVIELGHRAIAEEAARKGDALIKKAEGFLAQELAHRAKKMIEAHAPGFAGYPVSARLEAVRAKAQAVLDAPYVPTPTQPEGDTPTDPSDTPVPDTPVEMDREAIDRLFREHVGEPLSRRAFADAATAGNAAARKAPRGEAEKYLAAWAAEFDHADRALTSLIAHINENKGEYKKITVGRRLAVDIIAANEKGFDAAVRGGTSSFQWARVSAPTFDALFARQAPVGKAAFSAACLLRAVGQDDAAEAQLVAALEGGMNPQGLFTAVARWRHEEPPADGYVVFESRLVRPEERERLLRERAIADALRDIEHRDADKRRAAYEVLLGFGEAASVQLRDALTQRRARLADEIAGNSAFRSAKHKKKLFDLLEQHRAHALALIRDTKAYPYPNPQKLSQDEVNARVDKVRQVWERSFELIASWDDGVKQALESVTEVDEILAKVDPEHEPDLDAIASKASAAVNMPAYTPTAQAAKVREYSLQVLAFNERVPTTATKEEKSNVRVVSNYRMMMGMPAVKIEEHLVRGARGHSKHMREHGYFAHDVPAGKGRTPQNATPGARAKAVGYKGGVGENIATGPWTGLDAFKAWFGSSGHHRNMLGRWTEMGCGRSGGSMWTQLFGSASGSSLKIPPKLPDPTPHYAPEPEDEHGRPIGDRSSDATQGNE